MKGPLRAFFLVSVAALWLCLRGLGGPGLLPGVVLGELVADADAGGDLGTATLV